MTLHELGLNADTIFRLFIGILIIVVHLKVANKSSLVQFTSIDFIGNFILGGIIYNHTISMLNYIVMLLATIMMIAFLNYISENFLPARCLVRGDVVPIIEHGQFRLDSVGQPDAKFDLIDFMSVARSRGIFSVEDIEFAQIETNGSITVIEKGNGHLNYLLVKSGQIFSDRLERIGHSEQWLRDELAEAGIEPLDEVFLVELNSRHKFYIVKTDGSSLTTTVAINAPSHGNDEDARSPVAPVEERESASSEETAETEASLDESAAEAR